ncbi:MAG: trypsin-like serine protease [Gammaproteobacteria bacterium]|nr:trypsin-like serine protease [Gammaproteobacteria bacterium]
MFFPIKGRQLISLCVASVLSGGLIAGATSNSTKLEDNSKLHKGFNLPAGVWGFIWNDSNNNGRYDFREQGQREVTVYLDENDNGIRDPEEKSTETNRFGFYKFFNLPAGDYVIRQEVPFGWRNTSGGSGEDVKPVQINEDNIIKPSIIGGDETAINEYPFMVAVGALFDDSFFQFCGGVLISDRWVATAAHCSTNTDPSEVAVLAGTNNVEDGSGAVIKVKSIQLHPEFVVSPAEPGDPFSVSAGYDIALWELESPVPLGENGLETVDMLSENNGDLAAEGVLATAVGWGASDLQSRLLQDVHLPVSNQEECASVYSSSINFETQICGAAPEGGIDACQGDSGGPLLVRNFESDQWKLAGVTSYGNGCALPGNPGVWARVSVLSDWAKEAAIEPSRAHRVTLRNGSFKFAKFGNQSTRFEPNKPIDPRWQLVNSEVTHDEENGFTYNWRIIDESGWDRVFNCGADADGRGPLNEVPIPCKAGENQISIGEFEDGVFLPSLTAQLGDTNFSRVSSIIVGQPSETNAQGALAIGDEIDPDYTFDNFFVDYYDLSGLTSTKAIAIRVNTDSFIPFVSLYDRDFREAFGGGGILDYTFSFVPGEPAEFIIFPEPGVNYLLGVSSYFGEEVGDYTITVLNEGEAIPTVLDAPAMNTLLRKYRKLPDGKTIIPAPNVR